MDIDFKTKLDAVDYFHIVGCILLSFSGMSLGIASQNQVKYIELILIPLVVGTLFCNVRTRKQAIHNQLNN